MKFPLRVEKCQHCDIMANVIDADDRDIIENAHTAELSMEGARDLVMFANRGFQNDRESRHTPLMPTCGHDQACKSVETCREKIMKAEDESVRQRKKILEFCGVNAGMEDRIKELELDLSNANARWKGDEERIQELEIAHEANDKLKKSVAHWGERFTEAGIKNAREERARLKVELEKATAAIQSVSKESDDRFLEIAVLKGKIAGLNQAVDKMENNFESARQANLVLYDKKERLLKIVSNLILAAEPFVSPFWRQLHDGPNKSNRLIKAIEAAKEGRA